MLITMGYQITDDILITVPTNKFYEDLEKEGKKGDINLYKKNLKKIKDSDINLFECSLHSLSIGFMIEKSLEAHKPTIVLYLEDNNPHFLDGIEDEKLIVRSYNDKNLNDILAEALKEAKIRGDKRFNFFISPMLLSYLEKASKEKGVTKSTFIRNLLLDHMARSKQSVD